MPLPAVEEIQALLGHEFPGGRYTIAHWENFLLTECTGADPLPDNLAHPVALFHVPNLMLLLLILPFLASRLAHFHLQQIFQWGSLLILSSLH